MSSHDEFDIDNYTREDMNKIADILERWLIEFKRTFIIPDEILDELDDSVKEGIRRCKKLIEKLRKGDDSVFICDDDYDYFTK